MCTPSPRLDSTRLVSSRHYSPSPQFPCITLGKVLYRVLVGTSPGGDSLPLSLRGSGTQQLWACEVIVSVSSNRNESRRLGSGFSAILYQRASCIQVINKQYFSGAKKTNHCQRSVDISAAWVLGLGMTNSAHCPLPIGHWPLTIGPWPVALDHSPWTRDQKCIGQPSTL